MLDEGIAPALDRRKAIQTRWLKLIGISLIVVVLIAVLAIVPGWIIAMTPRWVVRRFIQGIGYFQIVVFMAGLVFVPVGLVGSVLSIRSARRSRRPWRNAVRVLTMSLSVLLALIMGELLSQRRIQQIHRVPELPRNFPQAPSGTERNRIRIVVIGESSARGEPYNPWLSVAQIAQPALRKVFPNKQIDVEILAQGGLCIEQAIHQLRPLNYRPDAILLYGGHNEFQARFGWDRNGAHYEGELAAKSIVRHAIESAAKVSHVVALAQEIIDLQNVDRMPLPTGGRGLVDHPCYSEEEYEFLRGDFAARIEHFTQYCELIGSLPILVVPPSNDAAYPPNRSFLSSDQTQEQRTQFKKRLHDVQILESTDSVRAILGYRTLLQEQPRFAEAHYRLARLLDISNQPGEARKHYTLARDYDGMPMRCPSDFRQAYFDTAARHPRALLIDGTEALIAGSPRSQLDSSLFHDVQHPNLIGYTRIANRLLVGLAEKHAFGWPIGTPPPVVTAREVANRFMDRQKWQLVCERTADYFHRTAYMRFESSTSAESKREFSRLASAIATGGDPELLGVIKFGDEEIAAAESKLDPVE